MITKFSAPLWLYNTEKSAWHFITVPQNISADLKAFFGDFTKGFGSLPVLVTIGTTEWKTSIFPDKKSACYFLPIKAEVRKKENLLEGNTVEVRMKIIQG
ncbi:MAG: DUF1905 domain-containing protein [Candidatus Peregrinibacteria bacterium]